MTYSAAQSGAYLHHLAFESSDPERLARFYADVMQMDLLQVPDGGWQCEGPARRIIVMKGRDKALAYAGMAVRDTDALDGMRERAEGSGLEIVPSPSPYLNPGAFGVRDNDGNLICFGLAGKDTIKTMGIPRPQHGGPIWGPLQHVTFASPDLEGFVDFYHHKLGFRMVDRVVREDGTLATVFVTSNHEHHTIACFQTSEVGVDHHSYEAGEWNYIRDWCDHFASRKVPLAWGPGRHGPGHNLFAFIVDPDGNWIEISAELEVIHDRPCEDWPQEPRSLNQWGWARMRS